MKTAKNLTLLSFIILFFNLTLMSQSNGWKNVFADVEVNHFELDGKVNKIKIKKTFFNTSKNKYNQTVEEDSKKATPGYLHLLIGFSNADVNPTILSTRVLEAGEEFGGLSSHFAAGAQFNNYLGVGLGVFAISTLDSWNSHLGFVGTGININGYPGILFYNATFGIVTKYKLIDDKEYRSKTFDKEKSAPLFFEVKGGLRISKKFVLGIGYFASSKIKGIYKEYEVPWSGNISIFDEVRKSKLSGIQFFIGFTFI
ncbi:MAG: hypothetical protein AB8F94_08865 [Saprospiraceae bacterium]